MKSLLVLCLFVAATYAKPANIDSYEDYDIFSFFPFAKQPKKQVPVVIDDEVKSDEDSSSFLGFSKFRPLFINPFSFMNFGFSDFFSKPYWFNIPEIADTEGKNETSSVQIINGHKVVVNETTYKTDDNKGIFKVKIIQVSPVDSTETQFVPTEEETEIATQREEADPVITSTEESKPDYNSLDNEIHREEMLANYELQGDDPSVFEKNVEMIDFGNNQQEIRRDLSEDIRVNQLLAENAHRGGLFMIPPEVEVFDVQNYDRGNVKYQQQIIEPQINQQQIVESQFNQEIIGPQFNQQHI